MRHNLITRYWEYVRRRDELLRLQRALKARPTETRVMKELLMSEALTKVHQSVMAALYDRTRLHAQRYQLEGLVKRFRAANGQRKAYEALKARVGKNPTSERIKIKLELLAEEIEPTEQELMADAIKAISRIIDLESRDE